MPIILFGVSAVVFVMLRVLPGQNPAEVIAGQGATQEQIEALEEQLGLNEPIWDQYRSWLGDLLRGDFGEEFYSQKSIKDEFIRRFPPSFQIVAMSLVIGTVVGIGFGIISAIFRNRAPTMSCVSAPWRLLIHSGVLPADAADRHTRLSLAVLTAGRRLRADLRRSLRPTCA